MERKLLLTFMTIALGMALCVPPVIRNHKQVFVSRAIQDSIAAFNRSVTDVQNHTGAPTVIWCMLREHDGKEYLSLYAHWSIITSVNPEDPNPVEGAYRIGGRITLLYSYCEKGYEGMISPKVKSLPERKYNWFKTHKIKNGNTCLTHIQKKSYELVDRKTLVPIEHEGYFYLWQ